MIQSTITGLSPSPVHVSHRGFVRCAFHPLETLYHDVHRATSSCVECIEVEGGASLRGTVQLSGSKNASLPMLCAALLAQGDHVFRSVPRLRDIASTLKLLRHLGCRSEVVQSTQSDVINLSVGDVLGAEAPYELVCEMRASVLVLGPLLARLGRAKVSLPGGCAIGTRPIDQHLKGLEALGARVQLHHGYVDCEAPGGRLRGGDVCFDMVTVTGTENLLAAATLAEGRTRLLNAAREPEVVALATMLKAMGARISGEGTSEIVIEGVEALQAASYEVPPDRIEAGTYMVAAALTGGDLTLEDAPLAQLEALTSALRKAGAAVEALGPSRCRVTRSGPLRPVSLTTAPYPEFATDMQAQWMVLMTQARGESTISERIFENRFMHVPELGRLGAQLSVDGDTATVTGPTPLEGAVVTATDLRASACLVLAGLVAHGVTRIRRVYHLDRGYDDLVGKLNGVGARLRRVRE